MRFALTVFVALCALQGCATLEPLEPWSGFPDREAVAGFLEKELPVVDVEPPEEREDAAFRRQVDVDLWVMEQPELPRDDVASSPRDAIEWYGVEKGWGLSEQASCLARARARFQAERGALPSASLDDFMDRYCGVDGEVRLDTIVRAKKTPGAYTQEQALLEYTEELEQWMPLPCEGEDRHLGLAFAQNDTHVVFGYVLVSPAFFKTNDGAKARRDASGYVTLRARTTVEFSNMKAYFEGADGAFSECSVELTSRTYEVDVHCPVAPDMGRGTVVVHADYKFKRGWRGMYGTFSFVEEGLASNTYEGMADYGDVGSVVPDPRAPDFASLTVDAINALRAERGLEPFTTDPAQDEAVHRLESHMHVQYGCNTSLYYRYRNAVLAGWDVAAPNVWGAELAWSRSDVAEETSVADMLVRSPLVRHLVFHSGGGQLVVDHKRNRNGTYRVVFVLYKTMPDETPSQRHARTLKTINATRARKGLPKSRVYRNFKARAAELSVAVESGELSPAEAKEAFLDEVKEGLGRAPSWYATFTDNLDNLSLKGALFERERIDIALMVAPYHSEDLPRSRYLVVIGFRWQE